MYPGVAGDTRIACICTTNVTPTGRFHSRFIVFLKHKVVVAPRVRSEFGVIMERAQCQRRTAAPATHHLRRKQLLVVHFAGISLQKFTEVGHALMKLSEDNVGSVPAKDFRRCLLNSAKFICVTNHKLTGFKRHFAWIRSRNPAAFDRGMTDSIAITEWFFLVW